ISILIPACREDIECVIQVEVKISVEVTPHKFMNFLLVRGMKVLELMHGRELLDIQAIGQDTVRFSLQQMLTFVGGDMGDCGENIGGMCCSAFDAIPVIYASLPSFRVNVEPLEVVIKVDRPRTEVSS